MMNNIKDNSIEQLSNDMKDVKAFLSALQSKPLAGDTMTFGELISQWFEWKKPRWRVNTYDNYMTMYKNHVKPHLETLTLSNVTVERLQGVIDGMMAKKLSSSAMTTAYWKVIAPSLKYAEERGYIKKSPAKMVSFPTDLKDKEGEDRRALTDEEIKRLLSVSKGTNLWIAVPLLLFTGLRLGELLALRWEDIDLDGDVGVFDISKSYVATVSSGNRLEGTKNRFSTRKVGSTLPALVDMLREYKETYGKGKTYVISQQKNDKMVDPNNFRRTFERWTKDAGFPEVTPHFCRHTYITQMIASGTPLAYIAEQVGHKDLRMILTKYADRKISKARIDSTLSFSSNMSKLIA